MVFNNPSPDYPTSSMKKKPSASAVKFCVHCGLEFVSSHLFCVKCGKRRDDDLGSQSLQCCGSSPLSGHEYCGVCGKKLSKIPVCDECGRMLLNGAKYCGGCGKAVRVLRGKK